MTDVRITVPAPFGGVSRQPPKLRHKNQVEDAENVLFSVVDGFGKRAGSVHLASLDGLFPKLTTATWTESTNTLTQSNAFTDYTWTSGDRLFISGGTNVVLGVYEITARTDASNITLGTSISRTGGDLAAGDISSGMTANRNYRQHRIDRDAAERYIVIYGQDTVRVFSTLDGTEAIVQWDDRSNDTTRKFVLTNATWTQSTKTLSEAGAFANYTFTAGDVVFISGGSGDTETGIYEIASNPNNNDITLKQNISLSDQTGVTSGVAASDYFSSTDANDISMVTIADYTIITNRSVVPGTRTSANYNIANNFTDYPAMSGGATVAGEYYETDNSGGGRSQGTFYTNDGAIITDANGFILTVDDDGFIRVPAPNKANSELDATRSPLSMVRTSLSPLTFSVNLTQWVFRKNGDSVTNPLPMPWKDGLKISDVGFQRNRMIVGADESTIFSQSGDVFNFFIEQFDNVVDSDPISAPLSSSQVAILDYLVPFSKSIIAFTKASEQFQFTATVLKPGEGDFLPTTSYYTIPGVRPDVLGHKLYFASEIKNTGAVHEYFFTEAEATNIAGDITKHVAGYLPTDIKSLATSVNANTVIVTTTDDAAFFVYRAHWDGNDKVQSAWGKYTQESTERIVDVKVIRDDLFMLTEMSSGYVLDRLAVTQELPETSSATWYGDVIEGLDYTNYTGITDAEFRCTINGVTADVGPFSYAAATSNADLGSITQTALQAAFSGSPLCRVQGERFVITSDTTGVNSEVKDVVAVPGGGGTDIATLALMGAPGTAYSPTMPYNPRIDRKIEVTGSYNSSTNETTWDYTLDDPTLDQVVLGRDFGPLAGARLTTTRVNNNSIKVSGDFSHGEVIIGRDYLADTVLSPAIRRDRNDRPILDGRLQIRQLIVSHRNSGAYTVKVSQPQRADREVKLETIKVGVSSVGELPIADGELTARIMGKSDEVTIRIQNDTPLPHVIDSFEFLGDWIPKRSNG